MIPKVATSTQGHQHQAAYKQTFARTVQVVDAGEIGSLLVVDAILLQFGEIGFALLRPLVAIALCALKSAL